MKCVQCLIHYCIPLRARSSCEELTGKQFGGKHAPTMTHLQSTLTIFLLRKLTKEKTGFPSSQVWALALRLAPPSSHSPSRWTSPLPVDRRSTIKPHTQNQKFLCVSITVSVLHVFKLINKTQSPQ